MSINVNLDGSGNVVQVEVESIAQLIALLKTAQAPRNWDESPETRLQRVAAKRALKSLLNAKPPFRFLPTQSELQVVLSLTGSVNVKIEDHAFCRFASSTFLFGEGVKGRSSLTIRPLSFSSLLLMESVPIESEPPHPLNSTHYCSVIQVNHAADSPDIPLLCVFTLYFEQPVEFPCVIRGASLGIRTESSVIVEEGQLERDAQGNWAIGSGSTMHTPVSVRSSIEFDVEKESAQFIVIDAFGLLEKYMEEEWERGGKTVRAVFSLETQKVEYPSVFWYGNHVLVESDDYAVGLIQTIVLKRNVLLGNANQGDDIIIQFQEYDEV